MASTATNWMENPSVETNTNHYSIAEATMARVTDLSYSGTYALELTATTGSTIVLTCDTEIPAVEGETVFFAVRTYARQPLSAISSFVDFYDNTDTIITGDPYVPNEYEITEDGYDWTLASEVRIAPAGSVYAKIKIWLYKLYPAGISAGDKWVLDGFEARVNQPLDGYFDGNTANCFWFGTPNNSASFRKFIDVIFSQDHDNDDFEVLYRIWSVDDDLNDDVELTDWVDGGSIKSNVEDDIKRTASFEFKSLSVLNPFVTRLKVYMEKYVENVLTDNTPLGVFSIDMPDGTVTYEQRYGTVEANDIAIELVDSARRVQFVYQKNSNIVDTAEARVRTRGYKANFPNDTKKFSKTEKFPQWMGDLELVNTLLEKANMRGCYGDPNGIIVTNKIKKLSQTNPVLKINQHEVMSLSETNDTENLCNVVKVYKDNPDGAPIYAIAINDDVADPVSTVNMRLKTVVINDSEVEDNGDAQDLADAKLEEGKSFDKTLDLEIAPNPDIGIGNVIDLEFDMQDGTCYCGRYWVREWELPLASPFWMKLSVNRVQKFHDGLPEDE